MANGCMTDEEYQEYKKERYSKLRNGDEVWLNVAHFMKAMKNKNAQYCSFDTSTGWDKKTDCDYEIYELYNDNGDFVCSSTIECPQCCCGVVEVNDNEIVLECQIDINKVQFKLTKKELFIAATKYDGWDWEITF